MGSYQGSSSHGVLDVCMDPGLYVCITLYILPGLKDSFAMMSLCIILALSSPGWEEEITFPQVSLLKQCPDDLP